MRPAAVVLGRSAVMGPLPHRVVPGVRTVVSRNGPAGSVAALVDEVHGHGEALAAEISAYGPGDGFGSNGRTRLERLERLAGSAERGAALRHLLRESVQTPDPMVDLLAVTLGSLVARAQVLCRELSANPEVVTEAVSAARTVWEDAHPGRIADESPVVAALVPDGVLRPSFTALLQPPAAHVHATAGCGALIVSAPRWRVERLALGVERPARCEDVSDRLPGAWSGRWADGPVAEVCLTLWAPRDLGSPYWLLGDALAAAELLG